MSQKQFIYAPLMMILTLFAASAQAQTAPRQDTVRRLKTLIYLSKNKIDSAIYTAKQLNESDPTNQKSLLLATLYERKSDSASANTYFARALSAPGADTAQISYMRSMAAFNRKDTATAKAQLLTSLRYDSSKASRYFLLGKLYSYTQNPDSALLFYTRAYQVDPGNLGYTMMLYSFYRTRGMIRESLPYLINWAAKDTTRIQPALSLATQQIDLDMFQQVWPLVGKLTSRFPANDSCWFTQALCALGMGDTATALNSLRQAINLAAAPNINYYDKLVSVYEATGQTAELVTTIRQGAAAGIPAYKYWISQYDTSRMQTRITDPWQLAKLALFQKDDAAVLSRLAQYRQQGGAATDSFYYIIAAADYHLGRNAEALANIDQAISMNTSSTQFSLLLVAILYQSRKYNRLIDLLRSTPGLPIPVDDRNALLAKANTILNP